MAKRKTIKKKFDKYLIEATAPSAKDSMGFIPRIANVFPIAALSGILSFIQEKSFDELMEQIKSDPSMILLAFQEATTLLAENPKDSLPQLVEDFFKVAQMKIIKNDEEDVEIDLHKEWGDFFDLTDIKLIFEILAWAFTGFFTKR